MREGERERMTPEELGEMATTLFGRGQWMRALARELGVSDRSVRYWAAGERPIPAWVRGRIGELAAGRAEELQTLAEETSEDE